MIKLNRKLLIVFFLLAIFILAIGVWYSPVVFKGYANETIPEGVNLAKNYHETGILAFKNDKSVVLSSTLVKEEGYSFVKSQYLRSLFYAKIFDIFGVPNYNSLILISIILYALVLILFTVLVLYLFDFKIAIVFSLIYIFSPLGWSLAYSLCLYEFCLLFLALFFIFYFWGLKKSEESKNKIGIILFSLSGMFLALSALSKEVTLIFALAFGIFLLFKKLKKQLIFISIPFVIILMIFWLPSVIGGENKHLSLLPGQAIEKSVFAEYLHLFPDPYTYHFEKEEFLEEFKSQDFGITENLEAKKILINLDFGKIGLVSHFKVGIYLLFQHIAKLFSLEDFGGPLITLLLILGLVYLKKERKLLYNIFLYWLIIALFLFSFVFFVGRSHLMDFIWILILLVAFGLVFSFRIIEDYFKLSGKKAIFLEIAIIILVLYHLVLVNHVVLGEKYDEEFLPKSIAYAQAIEKFEIQDRDVIAIPEEFSNQITTLNYLTDKSFVIFRSSTLIKLLKENKINEAFEYFEVKYILGYSEELSNEIEARTNAINIASNSLKIDMGKVSEDKSFFMNLVR